MALGERNSNVQNDQIKNPSTFSSYAFSNSQAELEKSCLQFEYWKGFLKVAIAPLKEVNADGVALYDKANAIAIFLKHAKVAILLKELEAFMTDPNKFTNRGVNSGSGLISFSNGAEFGYPNTPCLVIRKVSPTGVTEASIAYVFRQDFHFAVRNYNEDQHTSESDYEPFKMLELELFRTLLINYLDAGTSAYASEAITKYSYQMGRISDNIEAVAQKLGVDFGNRNKARSNNSFFASNNSGNTTSGDKPKSQYEQSTIDDINSLMTD